MFYIMQFTDASEDSPKNHRYCQQASVETLPEKKEDFLGSSKTTRKTANLSLSSKLEETLFISAQ